MSQLVYVMQVEMYPGAWHDRFTFHAITQADAETKASRWARYQGLSTREVKAVIATDECANWTPNDDYVD